jgi:hypothetical protein
MTFASVNPSEGATTSMRTYDADISAREAETRRGDEK